MSIALDKKAVALAKFKALEAGQALATGLEAHKPPPKIPKESFYWRS
jgi:hypothetical protein